jgi:hypothetical protein
LCRLDPEISTTTRLGGAELQSLFSSSGTGTSSGSVHTREPIVSPPPHSGVRCLSRERWRDGRSTTATRDGTIRPREAFIWEEGVAGLARWEHNTSNAPQGSSFAERCEALARGEESLRSNLLANLRSALLIVLAYVCDNVDASPTPSAASRTTLCSTRARPLNEGTNKGTLVGWECSKRAITFLTPPWIS